MNRSFVFKSAVCIVAVALLCGCAGMGKGPSDPELVAKVLVTWKTAMEAKDVEKVMTVYSESFSNDQMATKAKLKEFFLNAIDMGYLEGAQTNIEQAKKTIEGTTAKVYPIDFSSDAGQVTIELTLTKEKAGWLITGMNIEGL